VLPRWFPSRLLRRSMYRMALVISFAVGALALWALPAEAWTSPANTWENYYMPGPPPGSYLSACNVSTINGESGDVAYGAIEPFNNAYSACDYGAVQVVWDDSGTPVGGVITTGPVNTVFDATGPSGYYDIGANFGACNIYNLCDYWSTSWI